MTIDDLLQFVDDETRYRRAKFGAATDDQRRISRLLNVAKLGEEAGELAAAALALGGYQRQDKVDAASKAAVGEEVVDVIITALMVAAEFEVSMEAAFEHKLAVIKRRRQA